ncbi:uncharacterized protein A4U43_C10F13240 [Asparagus officinalis]|uniref:Uncharacterized protein n=1 Tax=Asparagus officinalis TaxID=4686 RepID=A0A5P1E2P5_ASPOF|nr:uncharacterized protein A4U43_C10F13240 [Asparagus officinalis]
MHKQLSPWLRLLLLLPLSFPLHGHRLFFSDLPFLALLLRTMVMSHLDMITKEKDQCGHIRLSHIAHLPPLGMISAIFVLWLSLRPLSRMLRINIRFSTVFYSVEYFLFSILMMISAITYFSSRL